MSDLKDDGAETPGGLKILPCPFCGSSMARIHKRYGWKSVKCWTCGAEKRALTELDDVVVAAWNKRPKSEPRRDGDCREPSSFTVRTDSADALVDLDASAPGTTDLLRSLVAATQEPTELPAPEAVTEVRRRAKVAGDAVLAAVECVTFQRDALGHAIADVAVKAGVCRGDVSGLTGPQLLALADDLVAIVGVRPNKPELRRGDEVDAIDHYREGLYRILRGDSDPIGVAAGYLGEVAPASVSAVVAAASAVTAREVVRGGAPAWPGYPDATRPSDAARGEAASKSAGAHAEGRVGDYREPFASRYWAILDVEGSDPEPVALFLDEGSARAERERRVALHEDDDDRLSTCHHVFHADVVGTLWNSYDRDPRRADPLAPREILAVFEDGVVDNVAMDLTDKYLSLGELIGIMDEPHRTICERLVEAHGVEMQAARGSTSNHQAWPGGYLDHVREVMNVAVVLYEPLHARRPLPFTLSDALVVLFLHDLEKPWAFVEDDDVWRRSPSFQSKGDSQSFRMAKLAEHGLRISAELESAVAFVEGEILAYSSKRRAMSPLAAFCHLCDVTSARIWFDRPSAEGDPWPGAGRSIG